MITEVLVANSISGSIGRPLTWSDGRNGFASGLLPHLAFGVIRTELGIFWMKL